jgi:hypothetical protein
VSARRPANPERFVSASELGEYAYCRRAWWLRAVRGVTTAEHGRRFSTGRGAHARHAATLILARALAAAAAFALLAALVIAALRSW